MRITQHSPGIINAAQQDQGGCAGDSRKTCVLVQKPLKLAVSLQVLASTEHQGGNRRLWAGHVKNLTAQFECVTETPVPPP